MHFKHFTFTSPSVISHHEALKVSSNYDCVWNVQREHGVVRHPNRWFIAKFMLSCHKWLFMHVSGMVWNFHLYLFLLSPNSQESHRESCHAIGIRCECYHHKLIIDYGSRRGITWIYWLWAWKFELALMNGIISLSIPPVIIIAIDF